MNTSIVQAGHVPIIVLNWNGIEDTIECIDSVLKMGYPDFKVYLLDNGSDNNEGEKLSQKYADEPLVTVRLFGENLGFTHAHIRIVEELQAFSIRYIALLNNDTIVDRNWLSSLLKVALAEHASVISSKLIYYYDRSKLDNVGHQMLTTGEVVPIGYARSSEDYETMQPNFGSCAGATLYSVEMIKQIGFFDPYFSTGYEDAEFGARAVVTGFKCVFAPEALVYHKVSRSVTKVYNDAYELMIRNAIWYTYLKLMPRGVLFISAPFVLIKIVLLTLLNLITGRSRENRLMYKSLRESFGSQWDRIKTSRDAFQKDHDLMSTLQIVRKQTFFLFFDLQRVWQIWFSRRTTLGDY